MKKIAGDIHTAVTFVEAKRQIDASTTSVDYAGVNIPLKGGYPEGDLSTMNKILDIKTPSSYTTYWQSNSRSCEFNDFCMVGKLVNGRGPAIPGHISGKATYIWPNGYVLDGCFSYYVNLENGELPLVGAVTDKC